MNAFLALQGTKASRGVKRKAMDDLSALIECTFKNITLTSIRLTVYEAHPAPPPPVPHQVHVPSSAMPNTPFPEDGSMNFTSNSHTMETPAPPQVITSSFSPPPAPTALHQSQIIVSANGNIYPMTTFPLSQSHPDVQVKQMLGISKLEGLFPMERLKQHNFEWNPKLDEWLPHYNFWRPSPGVPPTVDQIWEEYTEGIGNPRSFSILELTANWGGRWKRNIQKIKTESSKRKKVVDLVQVLLIQPSWDSTKALAFLQEKYPVPSLSSSHPFLKNISAFIAHLQTHKNALSDIIKSSS